LVAVVPFPVVVSAGVSLGRGRVPEVFQLPLVILGWFGRAGWVKFNLNEIRAAGRNLDRTSGVGGSLIFLAVYGSALGGCSRKGHGQTYIRRGAS
jgi:hypothetical protein